MDKLKERVKIKNIWTKNRIAVPPMVCFHWSDDSGCVTDKNLQHYRDMAAGGAGLIIAEATAVTKRGRLHETQLGLWEDKQTEGWKRLADAVHQYDVPFFVQLHHAGVSGIEKNADCPSDYSFRDSNGELRARGCEMSPERVREVIDDFVQAARRAKQAGLDGIELHGCHSYLICQFFNRNINHREDIYGQRREKFALDILEGIRESCGEDFVAGIRLGAFEPALEDGIEHALSLAGKADFLDISYGFGGESISLRPEGYPFSEAIYGAQEIKKRLPDMPVFGVDGITDGEMAEKAILQAGVDMIDGGRGFLVNPNFGNDVLEGRSCGKCLHCRPACKWSPFLNDGTVVCPGRNLFLRNQKQ